jgi:hypothetical protein
LVAALGAFDRAGLLPSAPFAKRLQIKRPPDTFAFPPPDFCEAERRLGRQKPGRI